MSKVTGVIQKVRESDKGYFAICVDDVWYGCWKNDFSSLEGQEVVFEAVQKGDFMNVKGEVKATGNAPSPTAAGRAAPAQSNNERQQSIVLQSSYKTAADILGTLISNDKVGLGTKAKAYDAALNLLDEIAVRIYDNCIDPVSFLSGGADAVPAAPEESDYKPTEA